MQVDFKTDGAASMNRSVRSLGQIGRHFCGATLFWFAVAQIFNAAAYGQIPSITAINPSSATAGGPSFTLTVTGTGFAMDSTVLWNGSPLTTTFVTSTQVTASISTSLI